MHFSCSRAPLAEVLSTLTEIVPSRGTRPVLQNILLEGQADGEITLSATDLQIGMSQRLMVGELRDPERVLLPAARLYGIIRDEWADELTVDIKENRASITTTSGQFRLVGSAPEEFPALAGEEDTPEAHIAGSDIAEAVHKTAFATAHGDTRFALNGVFVCIEKGQIEFVASDTHRLSLVKKKIKNKAGENAQGIVVTKGMTTLAKVAAEQDDVALSMTPQQFIARTPTSRVVIRLVDGQFPRYRDVLPRDLGNTVTVNRELLIKTLRLGGQLSSEETRCVTFGAAANRLLLSVSGADVGEAKIEIDAKVVGGEVSASFNYLYVMDALRVMDDEEITLQLKDSEHPARIDVGDFTHIIMPIKPRG